MAKSTDESMDFEYSIDAEDNCFFDCESPNVSILGKLRRPLRYNLKQLMESNAPEHKEIVKSAVINAVEKNFCVGFQCFLYKNYQITPLNDKNQTALHLAFYTKSTDIMWIYEEYLESKHCQESNQIDYTDINGLTHLHVASAYADIKLVDTFSKNNSKINARFVTSNGPREKQSGFTPLHFAVNNYSRHRKDIIELLIKRGADVNAVDNVGKTPLHIIASTLGQYYENEKILDTIKALIDCQADVNAKDNEGNTPLFVIFSSLDDAWKYRDDINAFSQLTERTELRLKLFLELGADTSVKNNNNDTVLHFTVNYLKILRQTLSDSDFALDDSKVVQLLKVLMAADQKIDMNVKNNDGKTPLTLAISCLSVVLVKFFLKYNADLTDLNFYSKTDSFFNYSYSNLATFKPLQNLIKILTLLLNEGCILKPKDNLTVLKFLINNGQGFRLRDYNFKSELFHMMNIESPKNLGKVLSNFCMDFRHDYHEDMENSEEYLDHFDNLNGYLYCINEGKVFMSKESVTLIENALAKCKKISRYDPGLETDDIDEELDVLESSFINDQSISDILMDKPENAARYLGNGIDKRFFNELNYFQGIVKGHLTIGMIRYYVIKLAYNCIITLHSTPLPYICYELLTDYLSNKDILNLCLAVLT